MKKFENVDLIKSMRAIMQSHTEHYQSDFEIDVKALKQAAQSEHRADRRQMWLCRPSGTWLLRERDVFLKETRENNTFCFYAEQTRDKILAYLVEVSGMERGKVTGNLYELDYLKEYDHVKTASIQADTALLTYENGERYHDIGKPISGEDETLGKLLRYEAQPNDERALRAVLWDNRYRLDHLDSGDIGEHIEKLSERGRKPSVRAELMANRAKAESSPKRARTPKKDNEMEV